MIWERKLTCVIASADNVDYPKYDENGKLKQEMIFVGTFFLCIRITDDLLAAQSTAELIFAFLATETVSGCK